LSGCLGRVAGATTNTRASPAAFYSGDASDVEGSDETLRTYGTTASDVQYVPATVRGGSGRLSGDVDIDGWGTSAVAPAQDYNSSRSNKPSTIWWSDPDDDGDGVDDEVHFAILDVELALSGFVESAQDGVGRRSKTDSKKALDGFIDATTKALQQGSRLESCPSDVCRTVRENMDKRQQLARDAAGAVVEENWGEANSLLSDIERIVESDIERLETAIDPETIASMAALRAYLDDEPTVSEQFAVCLPDARLPGDRGSLEAELTPKRLLNYLIGERDADKCGDSEQTRTVSLHPDISCRKLLSARISEQATEKRGVAAFTAGDGVCVAGVPADADGAEAILSVAYDQTTPLLYQGLKSIPDSLDGWGAETTDDDVAVTPTLVVPVLARPRDCPSPMPALLYVKRCKHDDQYIYCGGWIVDDGALYQNAATLLVGDGPTEVVAVSPEEVASDRYGAIVDRKCSRDRCRYGSTTFGGKFQPDSEYVPSALADEKGRKGLNAVNVKVVGERNDGGDDDGDHDGGTTETLVAALDAPVVHLATAEGNDVKFKAGAELSKSVN